MASLSAHGASRPGVMLCLDLFGVVEMTNTRARGLGRGTDDVRPHRPAVVRQPDVDGPTRDLGRAVAAAISSREPCRPAMTKSRVRSSGADHSTCLRQTSAISGLRHSFDEADRESFSGTDLAGVAQRSSRRAGRSQARALGINHDRLPQAARCLVIVRGSKEKRRRLARSRKRKLG